MSTLATDWLPRHRLTVDDYYRMAAAGVLAADARVELIRGAIIDMAPTGSRHAGSVDRLAQLLTRAVGDRAIVGVQRPIRLDAVSEPQPDIVLLTPRADFYTRSHPVPADILLVVEVADASLRYDRDVKLPLYAGAGITEVWLLDLTAGALSILRSPGPSGYASTTRTLAPGVVEPAALPGVAVDLTGIAGL